jgi:hypothetical protein
MLMDHLPSLLGCIVVVAIILGSLDFYYPILRDNPVSDTDQMTGRSLSYSLARVQMAFWTSMVLGSLIYLFLFSGFTGAPEVDNNLIALMGVSGATGIIAAAPDALKDLQASSTKAAFDGTANAIVSIDAQIKTVLSQPDVQPLAATYRPILAKLYADRSAQFAQLSTHKQVISSNRRSDKTSGFFRDLIVDHNGNSLHRIQLIVLTIVYGAFFVRHVALATKMQDALTNVLPTSALTLMGIAGGAYVGFKLPGK